MDVPATRSRILIVDDEPAMLHTIERILRRNYKVTCADSGEAALEILPQAKPHLAIVDIRMPGMSGFELTRRLKKRDPSLNIIVMTGNVEDPDGNLVRAINEGAFYFIQKPFDRTVLLTLVNRCLELHRLRKVEQDYVARLELELEEARQFQQSLIPPAFDRLAGVSINARYLACTELAGDLYDYAESADHSVAVLVADVVGHGASAAMMTSMIKSAFRGAERDQYEPLSVINRVKDGLRHYDASRFVTLVCARLNPITRELLYVNGGHPPAIIHAPGQPASLLAPTGPLLSSALYDRPHTCKSVQLGQQESLLLYTDGVPETRNDDGMFGQQRMISLATENGNQGGVLLDRIIEAVTRFSGSCPQRDDITLLALDLPAN